MCLAALAASLLFALKPTGFAAANTPLNGSSPRPFYVFAHNPNDLDSVTNALLNGCNAFEPDIDTKTCNGTTFLIDFDPDGGGIAACDQTKWVEWCDAVHDLALQFPQLALVVVDIKSDAAKAGYGSEIIETVHNHLNTNGVNLNVIYSVASTNHGEVFDTIIDKLGPREGVQVDADDSPDYVLGYFFGRDYFGNIGYGDGTATPGPDLPRAIDRAAFLRATIGEPKAVTYVYTVSTESSMHSFINAGVDGIIVTDGSQTELVDIVKNDHPEVRMATRDDNPFKTQYESYGLEIITSDVSGAGTDADLTFTLHGCRGSATITVNSGYINALLNSGRMEQGNTDYVTIPSADLGQLTSITVHHNGNPNDKWQLQEIRVSSLRWLGMNIGHTREYTATFNQVFVEGDTFDRPLTPNFQSPAPTIQCPSPVTVPNDLDQCGAAVSFSPLVKGPCDDVTAVCIPPSGTLFAIGTTPVTCYATNTSGSGSAPCTFTVTVQDTQAPVITCPPPMVVNATGPAGAVVPFTVTATDNCGATVISTPASGSVFAIGDTTVQSTAADSSANQASCSFNVHVKGAAEQTADLLTAVNSLNLSKPGVKSALLFQLNTALAGLQSNNLVAACGSLQSFIGLVDAQRNKTISSSDADYLIAAASQIQAVIGCTP
jgi:HYR domain/PLAT/LH2 domain